MSKTYKKSIIVSGVFIIVLTIVFFAFCPISIAEAAALTTDVMDDLTSDPSFDVEDYPAYEGNYNLNIIQIAESTNKELFIYVYQPSYEEVGLLNATSISFSITPDEPSFKLYKLKLLSTKGVFSKYVVEDFFVKDSGVREYAISEIFREKRSVDEPLDDDNLLDEIACEVAQKWTAMDYNGTVVYSLDELQVVTILHQWVGEIVMNNGTDLSGAFGVSFEDRKSVEHFISFRCNYDINYLYEAEVTYVTQDVFFNKSAFVSGKYNVNYGPESDPQTVVLHDDHWNTNSVHGIGGRSHSWKDIETVEEFKQRVSLDSGVSDKINGDQYVLSFLTSQISYKYNWGDVDYDYKTTDVKEVAILRLKFDSKGKVYNLGVVGNKQTSDGNFDNDVDEEFRTPKWFFSTTSGKSLLAVLGSVLGIAIIVLIVIGILKLLPYLSTGSFGGGKTSSKTDLNINFNGKNATKPYNKKKSNIKKNKN